MLKLVVAILLYVFSMGAAYALEPGEKLSDPVLEARARVISSELRCLVCQNQSIDDSNADLAKDLRRVVRERLTAGDTDQQVLDYTVERYGEFVLMRPRLSRFTWMLWATPALLLLAGAAAIFMRLRRRPEASFPEPLTAEEQDRLRKLLDQPR